MKKNVSIFIVLLILVLTGTTVYATPNDGHVMNVNGVTVHISDKSNVDVDDDIEVVIDNALIRAPRALYAEGTIDFNYGRSGSTSLPEYNYLWASTKTIGGKFDTYVNISRYYRTSKKDDWTYFSSGRVWDSADGRVDGSVKTASPSGYNKNNKANFGWF